MTFSVARSGYDIANSSHQVFTVSSATIVVITVSITNSAIPDSITSIILENLITGNDQPPLITSFQPKCKFVNVCVQIAVELHIQWYSLLWYN